MAPRSEKVALQDTSYSDGSDDVDEAGSVEESISCRACGREVDDDATFCPKCGAEINRGGCGAPCRTGWTCCCATFCVVLIGLLLIVFLGVVYFNTWVKASIQIVGSAALGTSVTVDTVDLGLPWGHVLITGLKVASPEGFKAPPLFKLGILAFDMSPMSLIPLVMDKQQEDPIMIDQLTIRELNVSIDQPDFTTSNAQVVSSHVANVTKTLSPVMPKLPDLSNLTDKQKTQLQQGVVRALLTKVIVGKIEFADIGIAYCFHPICNTFGAGPVTFELDRVLVAGVGKKQHGVLLIELIVDLITAILMAVIKVAPAQSRLNLLKALHPLKELEGDCETVLYDAGDGLVEVGAFTGWASAELAALPLRVAAMNAKLGVKGANFGMDANLEAAKLGMKANMGAAKLGMKANMEAAKLSAHMLGMGAKLGVAFAGGAAKAMTGGGPPLPPPPPPPPPR